jgi:indolepyruvate ferredoxin oxidoreductase
VSASALEEAITLNGVAVTKNIEAFRWGRAWVADRDLVNTALASGGGTTKPVRQIQLSPRLEERISTIGSRTGLRELLRSRSSELVAFQNERCASSYLDRIEAVVAAEARCLGAPSWELTEAAIRHLYQLTAYKDEYEVARLLTAGEVTEAARQVGGPNTSITWKLHPPLLKALGMKNKISLGPSTRPVMVALAKAKRLRGTPLDVFGYAEVRKLERGLVAEYLVVLQQLCNGLRATNHAEAVRIAKLPEIVRGYEDRKIKRAAEYRVQLRVALEAWNSHV